MHDNLITLSVNPPTLDGPVNLIAEVLPTNDINVFLVKEVSFHQDWAVIPFMSEFHLEKREVGNSLYWFNKDKDQSTLISQAIGKEIDRRLSLADNFPTSTMDFVI